MALKKRFSDVACRFYCSSSSAAVVTSLVYTVLQLLRSAGKITLCLRFECNFLLIWPHTFWALPPITYTECAEDIYIDFPVAVSKGNIQHLRFEITSLEVIKWFLWGGKEENGYPECWRGHIFEGVCVGMRVYILTQWRNSIHYSFYVMVLTLLYQIITVSTSLLIIRDPGHT